MSNDIEGIDRSVTGYSKVPNNEYGDCTMQVEYLLKSIDLAFLQSLFIASAGDPDLCGEYEINAQQAKALQPYVIDGKIDLDKYNFSLSCCQAKGWDWSKGYPPKKIET